jgi:hypothetical protein
LMPQPASATAVAATISVRRAAASGRRNIGVMLARP